MYMEHARVGLVTSKHSHTKEGNLCCSFAHYENVCAILHYEYSLKLHTETPICASTVQTNASIHYCQHTTYTYIIEGPTISYTLRTVEKENSLLKQDFTNHTY